MKTRALRNRILYNRLDDGLTGEASYELEFPNGGDNLVVGNLIVQSPLSQNPAILSMGAEAHDGMAGSLVLAHNTFVNHGGGEGRFVHLWADRLRGDTPVRMADNLFVGPGRAATCRPLPTAAATTASACRRCAMHRAATTGWCRARR